MKFIFKKLIQRASVSLAAIPLMLQIGKADVININDNYFASDVTGTVDEDLITLTSGWFGIIDIDTYVAGGDDEDTIILLAENGGDIELADIYGDDADLLSADPGDDLISLTASGEDIWGEDSTITLYGNIYGDEGNDEISLVAENYGDITGEDLYGNDGADDISVLAQSSGSIQLDGIYAGADEDEISVTASGEDTDVNIYDGIRGGSGNDIIELNANNSGDLYLYGDIDADNGDDEISLTATGEDSDIYVYADIEGDSGNDTITLLAEDDGYIYVSDEIEGDAGDDTISITATGEDSYVDLNNVFGGEGNDAITLLAEDGGYIDIDTVINGDSLIPDLLDDGDDEISLTATGEDSQIYIDGDADGIIGGNGNDTITLLTEDGGEIYIEDGDIQGNAGDDEISLTARGTSGEDSSYIYVDDEIQGEDGADTITLLAEGGGEIWIDEQIYGGAGNDTIELTATNALDVDGEAIDGEDSDINVGDIYGEGGADTIELTATGLSVGGNDTSIEVDDIYGGEDADTITLLSEDGGEIDAYGIYGEDGNDVISLTATGEGLYDDGEDTGYVDSEISLDSISGGNDDDQITLLAEDGGYIDIDAGEDAGIYGNDGEDTISLTATGTGYGEDSQINIYGDIDGGSDNDEITLLAEDDGEINLWDGGEDSVGIYGGDGEDTISLTATGEDSDIDIQGVIDGGSQNDEITLLAEDGGYIEMNNGEDSVGIYGGDGEDTISLTATGEDSEIDIEGVISGGSSDDEITLLAEDGAYIDIDDGEDGAGVFGDSGEDRISLTASGEDSEINIRGGEDGGFIDGGSYNDEITLLAEDGGNIEINSGEDFGGIYGGDGEDTISLTATGENSLIDVNYINGGSGEDEVTLSADNGGTLIVGDSYGEDSISYDTAISIDSGTDLLTIRAEDNGVVVVAGLVSANDGEDVITVDTTDDGAVFMLGGINGNNDTDLNLIGGLTSRLDEQILAGEGFDDIYDFVEAARGTGLILIAGEMENIDTITKEQDGLALIIGDMGGEDDMIIENIDVDGGSLYISGELYGQGEDLTQIVVEGGEEIGGVGIWNADVDMLTGALSAGVTPLNLDVQLRMGGPPMLSINELQINGSLDLAANTSIRYDLVPQLDGEIRGDGADLITHTSEYGGQVTFDEGSFIRLSPSDINQVVGDGRYVIVSSDSEIIGRPGDGTAGSGVSVQFNELIKDTGDYTGSLVPTLTGIQTANVFGTNLASFTTLRVVDNGDGEDLVADIVHNYEGLGGSNATLSSFGAAIDSLIYSEDPVVQDFIASLDYSDAASALAIASALSSENEVNKSVAMLNSNYAIHRRLENHLSVSRRIGSNGGNIVRQQVSSSGKADSSPLLTSSNCNVWGLISHDVQDYEASNITSNTDYDGNATAFTAGMDWRVSPTLVAGIMLDGSVGDYDYDGGTSENESMRIAAYGTWGQATGLYSDFAVAYGDHSMEDSRNFGGAPGGFGATNSATDATSLQVLATIGYAIQAGGIKHGPFAGLEYQSMDVDGFDVNNAFVPTSVGDYTMDSIRALIGYRAETTYGKFSPYASVAYAHEFEDDDVIVNATLAGSPFAVTTDGPGSAVVIGLGTGYMINESLSATVGYRGEITVDSQGMDSHGINMGLDWSF